MAGQAKTVKGKAGATSVEDTVVGFEVTHKLEVFAKSGVMKHAPGIATYREYLAFFNVVVFVE